MSKTLTLPLYKLTLYELSYLSYIDDNDVDVVFVVVVVIVDDEKYFKCCLNELLVDCLEYVTPYRQRPTRRRYLPHHNVVVVAETE